MKSIFELVNNDSEILGPGTDLVISLVAVLIMLLALHFKDSEQKINELKERLSLEENIHEEIEKYRQRISILEDSLDLTKEYLKEQDILLRKIKESQFAIINGIAAKYDVKPKKAIDGVYEIPITLSGGLRDVIRIQNDATLQRISFGNTILFGDGEANLKSRGKDVLRDICTIFKTKLNLIKEIQIQGHASADRNSITRGNDNLDLASRRSIAIFRFFRDDKTLQIDPAETIVSANSFGYYMPVERDYTDREWNFRRISRANQKDGGHRNKRIEIVLNYYETGE